MSDRMPSYNAFDATKLARIQSDVTAAYRGVPVPAPPQPRIVRATPDPAQRKLITALPTVATSDRVDQVLAVLAGIRAAGPKSAADVPQARIQATAQVARDGGIAEDTVADKYSRRLGNISRAEFDRLIWNWLDKDDRELQNVLERNVVVATQADDITAIREFFGDVTSEIQLEYTLQQLVDETFLDQGELERWIRAIERKRQAVLFGPPGTGKTFIAERLARHLVSGDDGMIQLVQFHPAYSYEDFIMGLRPVTTGEGRISYELVAGRFRKFCQEAEKRNGTCVFIIDEINRANIARVFGELMYLLEYRDREIPLASGGSLTIPDNVLIIGTMNTADRSIAVVDHALRRRFAFLALEPNFEILKRFHKGTGYDPTGLMMVLERINGEIGDANYAIGTSFFMRADLAQSIQDIWQLEIEPYLGEYFFDRPERAKKFAWEKVREQVTHEPTPS